jgi:hypothetical protein
VGSQVKVEKMPQKTKKYRVPITENDFYLMMHRGLRNEDFTITGDIIIVKDVSQEVLHREAEKPLYLARNE